MALWHTNCRPQYHRTFSQQQTQVGFQRYFQTSCVVISIRGTGQSQTSLHRRNQDRICGWTIYLCLGQCYENEQRENSTATRRKVEQQTIQCSRKRTRTRTI